MIDRKRTGSFTSSVMIGATAMMGVTTMLGTTSAYAASPADGLASNRTALSIPSGQEAGGSAPCTAGAADCAPAVSTGTGAATGFAGSKLFFLLGGLAVAGGVGAAVAGGHSHHSPVSP